MKYQKIILVASLLLLISAVSANTVGTFISQGATVFIGEEGLNVTEAVGDADYIGYWAPGSNTATTPPDKRLMITNMKTSFMVMPSEFNNKFGNWYRLDSSDKPTSIAFIVADPNIAIQVWNKDTNSAIYSNTVTSGSKITFRIDSNYYNIMAKRYSDINKTPITEGYITIKVIASNGASYTKLRNPSGNDISLENILITEPNQFWIGTWDIDAKNDGLKMYNGEYTVYAEVNLNRIRDNYKQSGIDYVTKTVTNKQSITLRQSTLGLLIDKESVIRGQQFTVTINGNANTDYYMWLTKTHDFDGVLETPPYIMSHQEGVNVGEGGDHKSADGYLIKDDVPEMVNKTNPYYAKIRTDDDGSINVSLSSSPNTTTRRYAIRLESADATKYDEVEISVEGGTMSIVANENQVFFIGETIRFGGVNSESYNTYLFIYGPNLPSEGAQITSPDPRHHPIENNNASTFKKVDVNSDRTWSWEWKTTSVALDSGTYTVYAVSMPKSRSHISESSYATTSIQLKKPTITASVSQPSVAKGDPLIIKGYAEGEPSRGVAIWIMGINYAKRETTTVNSDSSFSYEIKRAETETMAAGQYYVIVQHPMQNGRFDIVLDSNGSISNLELGDKGMNIFKFTGAGSLQGSDAAQALIEAIEDANIDDMYAKLQFTISNPILTIDTIGDKYVGDKFTLSGETNLKVDTDINIDIKSSSFGPTNKSQPNEFSGASVIAKTSASRSNDGYNTYTTIIDLSTFKPDEYIVTASSIDNDVTATSLFIVRPGARPDGVGPTLTVIPAPTTVKSTVVPTTTTPITPIPTTKQSPGFESIVAIIGIILICLLFKKQ